MIAKYGRLGVHADLKLARYVFDAGETYLQSCRTSFNRAVKEWL